MVKKRRRAKKNINKSVSDYYISVVDYYHFSSFLIDIQNFSYTYLSHGLHPLQAYKTKNLNVLAGSDANFTTENQI